MDPAVQVFELPLGYLALAALGLASLWILSLLVMRFSRLRKAAGELGKEKDWSIPSVDSQAYGRSPFHRWDPRIKIVSLLFFMFCTASLTRVSWACLALLGSVVSVGIARIPFQHSLRRLTAMAAFLGMFLAVMPLTVPARNGDTLLVFEHLSFISFNFRGFLLALLICLKASAIALMVEPLLATSPFSVTVHALACLRIPSVICQMILLAHRYLFVFQDETCRMAKGMNARGFSKRTDMETVHTIGNFLGMLLVRSFERTQRVYDAMLARGYNGMPTVSLELRAGKSDWVKGAFWVVAGLSILYADRFSEFLPPSIFWN